LSITGATSGSGSGTGGGGGAGGGTAAAARNGFVRVTAFFGLAGEGRFLGPDAARFKRIPVENLKRI